MARYVRPFRTLAMGDVSLVGGKNAACAGSLRGARRHRPSRCRRGCRGGGRRPGPGRESFPGAGAESWGSYEPDLGRVVVHSAWEPGDDDLVNLAVTRTLETGGDVFALVPGELEGAEVAAVLRY